MNYLDEWYGEGHSSLTGAQSMLRRVYMLGDNPPSGIPGIWQRSYISDIRGANEYGWYSILVRTGNFKGEGNSLSYPAKRVFDDAEHAVEWILNDEEKRIQNRLKGQDEKPSSGYISDIE